MPVAVRVEEESEADEEEAEEHAELEAIAPFDPDAQWAVMDLPDHVSFPGVPNVCKATAKILKSQRVALKFARKGWELGILYAQES